MRPMMKQSLLLALIAVADVTVRADEPDVEMSSQCEKIVDDPADHDDHLFNFHQHDERLDPNKFLKIVYQMMSMRKTAPVKKVTLDFNPNLHHIVGPYSMRSTVQHVGEDGSVTDTCYDITVQIHDTDECTHEGSPEWMHSCHESTSCVNTEGGYYCACKAGEWAVRDSGNGKCNGENDSTACCGVVTYDGAPHGDVGCRGDFQCHADSCAFNDCDPNALCVEGEPSKDGSGPNAFSCMCKERYRDVSEGQQLLPGRVCQFVDHCEAEDACPSGCACRSVVDQETDGYFCEPKPGFAKYVPSEEYEWASSNGAPTSSSFRLDEQPHHLCASQDAVELELIGAPTMKLAQGSKYEELGVRITDQSTVDLKRRFTTDYSNAEPLAPSGSNIHGFAQACGSYSVVYELDTPWISGHQHATTTRVVEVVDVDECSYRGEDPTYVNHCHFPAKCVNVQCGTEGFGPSEAAYKCVCEHEDFEPDGDNGCVRKEASMTTAGEDAKAATAKAAAAAAAAAAAGKGSAFSRWFGGGGGDASDSSTEGGGERAPVVEEGEEKSGGGKPAADASSSGSAPMKKEAVVVKEPLDDSFYEKLHEAFGQVQWNGMEKLHVDGLRNYKRLIAQMHLLTQEKEDLPADYAWDTPYKTMELDALRDKCVARSLASAVGVTQLSRKAAISLLAHSDHDAITEEVLSKLL